MKKILLPCFLFLILLIGCKNKQEITFEELQITNEVCDDCPKVNIQIPKATGNTKIAKIINTTLEQELITLLDYDDSFEVTTLSEALVSFKSGYKEIQQFYDDETALWEVKIQGVVIFEDPNFLTLEIDASIFTGGAHGYHSKRLLNFDKQLATTIENEELFTDIEAFQKFAEQTFRDKEGIPSDKPINYTGFMFEEEIFHLPENMGFTAEGLKLLYNQYEIASYADGVIELVLPHSEIENFIAKPQNSKPL